MISPGKYDEECESILRATDAQGVLLVVCSGWKGNGFSVSCDAAYARDLLPSIPAILRQVADQIESDYRKSTGN